MTLKGERSAVSTARAASFGWPESGDVRPLDLAPNVGRIARDGATRPITDRARRVLAAAVLTVDSDGTVCATLEELGQVAGVSRRTTIRALGELRAAGLVHVHGRTRLTYRYLDASLLKTLQRPVSKRPCGTGWRELRARVGGLDRALRAALRERDLLRQHLADRPTRTTSAEQAPVAAWLRREAAHAADCLDPDCERCEQLDRALESGDHEDTEHQVLAALEDADEIRAVARELLEAFALRGVGAHQAFQDAIGKMRRVLQ